MITQNYINRNGAVLATVAHWPEKGIKLKTGVVLAAGFSQSMCDVDYLMSKLARRLCKMGVFVLQLDPSGIGDSSGNLEDVSLDTLRQDLKEAVSFASDQVGGEVYCVGRGLTATIFSELASVLPVCGVAGINPFCVELSDSQRMWESISLGKHEVTTILSGSDYVEFSDFAFDKAAFFSGLGALIHNIHGQSLSTNLISDLVKYDSPKILKECQTNSLWLVYNSKEKDAIKVWRPLEEEFQTAFENSIKNFMPRDPMWQYKVIEYICNWI